MIGVPLETDIFVSGTFWLTVGLVVLTIALVVMTLMLVNLARNRRRIRWEQTSVAMLRNDRRLQHDLVVRWRGEPVTNPTLSTVRFVNSGREEISTIRFDNRRPMVVQFNSDVLALLEPEADEKDGVLPVRLVGNTVTVGPGVLRRGEKLTIVALTRAQSRCSLINTLVGVQVKEETEDESSLARRLNHPLVQGLIGALGVATATAALVVTIMITRGT